MEGTSMAVNDLGSLTPPADGGKIGYARLVCSTTLTLTLSILGSSVLPLPFAFSRTGVLLGLLVALFVAFANTLTSHLLLAAAARLGHDSYEALAHAVAGRMGKVATQLSLVLLLFGGFTGVCALLADVGSQALQELCGGAAPAVLVGGGGRGVMALLVLGVCLPLSLMKHMRSLEYAAMFGLIPLTIFMAIMVKQSVAAGLPALASGELPLWRVQVTEELPEAFAVLGYAFYLQPMLLPLLHEMPGGLAGRKALNTSVTITIMGVATVVYSVVGVFAAARWGLATEGDVLMNHWLSGHVAAGLLHLSMAAYLACSAVPVQMALRYTLDSMVAGEDAPFVQRRHVALTVVGITASLALALAFPRYSEKIFAITGALPVALICYIIPLWLHLVLYFRDRGYLSTSGSVANLETGLLAPDAEAAAAMRPRRRSAYALLRDVVVPVVVVAAMTGISIVAFWTSVRAFGKDATNFVYI